MRRPFLIVFACLLIFTAFGQQPDSIPATKDTMPANLADSSNTKRKDRKFGTTKKPALAILDSTGIARKQKGLYHRIFVKKYPHPRTAALLSFVVPGAGQAYNKRWWKIPIVYGALGGMAWLANDNNQEYKRLKQNYKWVVDEDLNTNPVDAPYVLMNSDQLKSYRDQFRRWTELSYLWLGIVHLLGVTDAFVDAHMASFDVSDDLSLRVIPDIQSATGGFGASFGVGIRLGFGRPSKIELPKHNIFVSP